MSGIIRIVSNGANPAQFEIPDDRENLFEFIVEKIRSDGYLKLDLLYIERPNIAYIIKIPSQVREDFEFPEGISRQ